TVVATGTIRPHNEAVNGRVTGELSIVAAEDSTFVLQIDEVSSPEYPTLAWALVDVPYDEVTCWEGFWAFDGGNLPMTAGSGGHISHVDPSAYREVLLTGTRPGEELVLGCTYPVIAIAQLSWTMPNPFAGLAPRDGGVRTGATGEVSERDDGTLATYTVAWGDSRGAIRDRFGLDLEEFWYLNPRNPPFLEPSTTMEQFAAADAEVPLNAGDIVNLDPADRSR
ncbi:hypothetical protein OOT08_14360, partial [Leucobacter sp. M11]|nr:hypothetical protein [Leucobacter sp. M11]